MFVNLFFFWIYKCSWNTTHSNNNQSIHSEYYSLNMKQQPINSQWILLTQYETTTNQFTVNTTHSIWNNNQSIHSEYYSLKQQPINSQWILLTQYETTTNQFTVNTTHSIWNNNQSIHSEYENSIWNNNQSIHSEYEIVIFFYRTFGLVNQDDSLDRINFYQTERKS